MNSNFGELFMFLTDLAWKNRITIPVLITTAFLILDIRLQIEIDVQSGHMAAQDIGREAQHYHGLMQGNGNRNANDDDDEDEESDDDYTTNSEYTTRDDDDDDDDDEDDEEFDVDSVFADLLADHDDDDNDADDEGTYVDDEDDDANHNDNLMDDRNNRQMYNPSHINRLCHALGWS